MAGRFWDASSGSVSGATGALLLEGWRLASVVEQTFGVWLGLGAVKQKTAPPAAGVVALRETLT
jgi:hypothetical protein